MDIKHLSNRQQSRKVVQLIYVGCPRIMQIYLVYRIAMRLIQLSFGVLFKLAIDIIQLQVEKIQNKILRKINR